jgi:nucleoid-associated protein YgaU
MIGVAPTALLATTLMALAAGAGAQAPVGAGSGTAAPPAAAPERVAPAPGPTSAAVAELRSENERLRERVATLEAALSQHEERCQTRAREHTAQLSTAELRTREHKERLLGAEARIRELQAELAARDARLEALADSAIRQDRLSQRLEELRARLPAPEGGSLTADEARSQAERDAAALVALVEGARGIDNPRLWLEVRDAENALHRSQFLLARADNARTVYRVRPGDSLAGVSMIFYGTAERWTELFDANRHVVQNPQALLPGITLVVP